MAVVLDYASSAAGPLSRGDTRRITAMRRLKRPLSLGLLVFVLLLATVGTAAADSQVHVVLPGENLFRISLQYGVSMDAIRAANHIYGDQIYVGQSLIIPDANAPAASSPPADTTSGGVTHVVQAGETLFTIGLQYNLTWTRIQAANGLVG